MRYFILLFIFSASSRNIAIAQHIDTNQYHLSGKITGIGHPVKMVLYSIDQSSIYMDSCITHLSGDFSMKGKVDIPVKATLAQIEINQLALSVFKGKATDKISFFLEPGKISMIGNSLNTAKIVAGKEQINFELVNKINDSSAGADESFNFIASHPKSFVSLWLLKSYITRQPAQKLRLAYHQLDEIVKESKAGKLVNQLLKTASATEIGQPASDFTLLNQYKVPISLSMFKGKNILIDFWASWCIPCRAENKNVKQIYNKFAGDSFEIIGISLDAKQDNWLQAIQEDQLPWIQLIESKNIKVAELYGVRSLPQNLLIDKNGKIIAKNLRGADLEKELKKLLL